MASTETRGAQTERTTLKRHAERGTHDFETIASVLDEGIFCHVGFTADAQPFVVPTAYGRDGRTLYLHGSAASRTMRALAGGAPVCVTVTLLDGLVLGRSAFRHSMNYRSVMILGTAHETSGEEKLHGLKTITEHMAQGRWADVRAPTDSEMKATKVLKLNIDEASAKARSGPPVEPEEDMALPNWAGVVPFALVAQAPIPDEHLSRETELPAYLRDYRRGLSG